MRGFGVSDVRRKIIAVGDNKSIFSIGNPFHLLPPRRVRRDYTLYLREREAGAGTRETCLAIDYDTAKMLCSRLHVPRVEGLAGKTIHVYSVNGTYAGVAA